jgi:pimeloyl-ACP methyl ester carboxylesterase/CHAT domain-containing protein
MAMRTYRIRGTLVDAQAPVSSRLKITSHRRVIPGRARDGVTDELDVQSDEVVRVELSNGFVHWIRFDDLIEEYGEQASSRDGAAVWELNHLTPPLAPVRGGNERGLFKLAIKVLDFFGISIEKAAARKLGEMGEQYLLKGNAPGLYHCPLEGEFFLKPLSARESIPADKGPVLIFLHGTASSTQGSFSKLWEERNKAGGDARAHLAKRYQDRVYALEHRSLTESPISNALELAERIPKGAEVHLVSHSRGGLIGELLCLSGCEDLETVLSPKQVETLFAADGTIWQQLGLSPLDKEAQEQRDKAYEEDREALLKLVGVLKDRFKVKRFVRVACPARGTTLASGRLDRWLSMLSFLLSKATGGGFVGDGVDFLMSVVKQRTDPRTLPGLEAMMPGSALTRLLQHPELKTSADLSVISGDLEGQTLLEKLSIKQLVTDWFYSADHDLVVNTGSMSGGLPRLQNGARFRKACGPDVDHFSYFNNQESVQWLVSGLTRDESDMGLFQPIQEAQKESPSTRDAVTASNLSSKPRPLAVVLPGIMGSELRADDDLIWLDYWSLFKGGLKKIANKPGHQVSTTNRILDDFYAPLLEFLARTHRLEVFPYDWRLSVCEAADKLMDRLDDCLLRAEKEQQPVHLVAHSMGGLVVRAMIADPRGFALWQRITQLPNSRFLMLGTPNQGSYEAVRWLTGNNPTQAKLSLLDITQNTDQIIDLVRKFPGLLELLPFTSEEVDFTELELWRNIKKTLRARWSTADINDLKRAGETWERLRSSPLDPQHMCYVAGCQPATVIGYQFSDYYEPWLVGRKRLDFLATTEGDGTVPWSSGRLPGIGTWYVEETAHDGLCARKRAFSGYLDLLMTGGTSLLPQTPPQTTRDAARSAKPFVLPASPPIDAIPSPGDLRDFRFGGGVSLLELEQQPVAPAIEISIRHGDLSYARHPVLVGHYLGDSILSAESVLNDRLRGALKQRLDLGLYPGPLDTHQVFFNDEPNGKPGGAIVLGLGQVGQLTPGLLNKGVSSALIDYALQVAQWPDDRFGKSGSPRHASVSCLLVGTSAGGISIANSVEAILRGAVDANEQLMRADLDNRVMIDRVGFLELYEDMALMAADAMRSILEDGELAQVVRWPDQVVNQGQAGRRRIQFDESPGWWHRLEICEDEHQPNTLRFIFATDRARAEETLSRGQLSLTDAYIESASASAHTDQDASRTLYEMLLPVRIREQSPRQSDLVLLVDRFSARYPWELLEDRWSSDNRPPAVKAGMIRQLKTSEFRDRPAHTVETNALVVGNPDLDHWDLFSDLPGARKEALSVSKLLAAGGFQVTERIDQPIKANIEALHRDAWRILHLSGHGVHEFLAQEDEVWTIEELCEQLPRDRLKKKLSGMVIGHKTVLTPGDVEQMRWVPELVFINCCHLGKTDSSYSLDRGGLAANLGVQFIRMGVRAVVAAGWAVDDDAARIFAETFYRHMLDGEEFGLAVKEAREQVWMRFPNINTWGAYQCYGDHGYRLRRDGKPAVWKPRPFSSPVELVTELENLTNALKVGGERLEQEIEQKISALLKRIPAVKKEQWEGRADVASALGLAWGEAGQWAKAIEWLERALQGDKGDCPVRAVEQCANYRVRQAGTEWMSLLEESHEDLEPQRLALIDTIESAILEMDLICQRAATVERLNLLGSACKCLALIQNQIGPRLEALMNMENYYKEAAKLGGGDKPYPFTSWVTARLLIGDSEVTLEPIDYPKLFAEADRLEKALKANNERDPNFWDSVSVGDIDLVRLIARCDSEKDVSQECQNLVDRIISTYQQAIHRGASPREKSSLIENLDFLLILTEQRLTLNQLVRQIIGALK